MAYYIPVQKDINIKELAQVFLQKIIYLYNISHSIILDRGLILISSYQKIFYYYLLLKAKFSIVFHPQTDRQIERQNQILEYYLCIYYAFKQDNWALWLNLAEFVYNDSEHLMLGITLFVAYTGCYLRGGNWPTKVPK